MCLQYLVITLTFELRLKELKWLYQWTQLTVTTQLSSSGWQMAIQSQQQEDKMGKGQKHYLKNGTLYKGGMHKMSDGSLHTGKTHTKTSKTLVHFKDLSKTAQKRAGA